MGWNRAQEIRQRISSPSKKKSSASADSHRNDASWKILRSMPFFLAFFLALGSLSGGLLDSWILSPFFEPKFSFPNLVDPVIPVLKASLEKSTRSTDFRPLLHSRHRVAKGDSLSHLAFSYGLSPSTLMSANQLDKAAHLKIGDSLIIPYTDGFRVSLDTGEDNQDFLRRYGVTEEKVRQFSSSRDLFVLGAVSQDFNFDTTASDGFSYPVQGPVITGFGESIDSLTGIAYLSDGIDLWAPVGTPVRASRGGSVILSKNHSSYGLYVMLAHGGGWKSFYGHLSDLQVSVGDVVSPGTLLGHVGDSGLVRSPRLHFVLIRDKEVVDPLDYLY